MAFPLFILNNAVVSLLAAGSASVFSRALGGNDKMVIKRVFGNMLFLSLVLSAILTGLGLIFSEELVLISWLSGLNF